MLGLTTEPQEPLHVVGLRELRDLRLEVEGAAYPHDRREDVREDDRPVMVVLNASSSTDLPPVQDE